jgi:SAM-dependent methyltransferase
VVDWGAGDGYVLGELLTGPEPPELVLAFEPGERMQALLEERRRSLELGDRLRWFRTIEDIEGFLDGRPIDVLACLGVLEHLPLQPRREFYEFAARTVAPDGIVLLDLPVEYGPAVVVKELGRRVLKGRPAEYRLRTLAARAVGRTRRDPRRFDEDGSTGFIYTHQGFDHREIVGELAPHFEVAAQRGSPLERAPAWAFNQEVLISLRRPAGIGQTAGPAAPQTSR